ncbi:MAG: cupredoxin domain-containing protein [Deltaproteobacteria bacterium]|nr:cupredoxin domain-containing protein [Deltaproteobacteria bacterium]
MNKRFLAAIFLALFASGSATLEASEFTDKYIEALDENDFVKQTTLIEQNKDKLPAEIKGLVDEAISPNTPKEEKTGKFHIAELLARAYKDISGDVTLIKEVKKKAFDAQLSAPVKSTAVNGVHTIEMPKATAAVKNVFMPDNIVIRKGETIRWVNTDAITHIFSAMQIISTGGFSSKSVEAGGNFEFKFDKPGEYFYLCFIHHAMVGKVTVEE